MLEVLSQLPLRSLRLKISLANYKVLSLVLHIVSKMEMLGKTSHKKKPEHQISKTVEAVTSNKIITPKVFGH